jgi:hypothetical protein
MSTAYPRPSTPEPITYSLADDAGEPISGADVTVRIRRADGLWYDWSDGSYAARGSVVELDEPMPELDEPGTYQVTWPGGADGVRYLAFVAVDDVVRGRVLLHVGGLAAPGDAMDLVADAVDSTALAASAVAEVQAGLATSAALATAASDAETARKYLANRREVSAIDSTDTTYDDDGTTPWRVHELADGQGNPIATPTGSPARRSAPT